METERLTTLDEVRLFISGSAAVDFARARQRPIGAAPFTVRRFRHPPG